MALSGSLLEFGLADIIQLIAQEKKTGKLILKDKKDEGFIVFLNGAIVGAKNKGKDQTAVLCDYMIDIKKCPTEKIRELFGTCKGSARHFAHILLTIQYITEQELATIAVTTLEDLVCDLFFWNKGNYTFDTLASVDDYVLPGASLSNDMVSMEAMRRIDEWQKMQEMFDKSVVFVNPNLHNQHNGQNAPSPILDPREYIMSLIDNRSSLEAIAGKSFLSYYRTFEIFYELLQDGRISQLPTEQADAIQTTERPTISHKASHILLTILITILLLAVLGGSGLVRTIAIGTTLLDAKNYSTIISSASANQKTRIARLYFQAEQGVTPDNNTVLIDKGLIDKRDIAHLLPQ